MSQQFLTECDQMTVSYDTSGFLHSTSRLDSVSGLLRIAEHRKAHLFQDKLSLQQIPTDVNIKNFLTSSVGSSH